MAEKTDRAFWSSLAVPEQRRSVLGYGCATVLFPAFGLLDLAVYPTEAKWFLLIRIAAGLLYGGFFITSLRPRSYETLSAMSKAAIATAGVGIAAMIHIAGDPEGPYYAGLCVTFVFAAAWFTWRMRVSITVYAVVLAAYYLPLFAYGRPLGARLMISNSFFLLSTAFVSLLGIMTRNRLARMEFDARQRLSGSMAELQQANRFKDEMLQNVSHELRTPLTLILAPLESLLERDGWREDDQRRFDVMRRNALRLLGLINDLLDLAKLGASSLEAAQTPVDVSRLMSRLREDTESMAHARSIELELELPPRPVVLSLDPVHSERVMLNLLSNALKFTGPGGRVTLGVTADEREVALFVEDTGIGISEQARERIFERFQQSDGGTTREHGGTGIGLALVAELTQLMGGRVAVDSEVGVGSRFSAIFPAALRLAEDAARGTETPVPEAARLSLLRLSREAAYVALEQANDPGEVKRAGRHGPRIVLAEDDVELNRELTDLLSPRYRVTSVRNGRAALEEVVREGADLIVSDVMMPVMDGFQLTEALRERPEFRDTPIVLLTARGQLEDRIRGRSIGADTYLTKPFHPRELIASIDGLLRARMRLVGSFLIRRQLGKGAQSQVFLAEHVGTGTLSALKIISQQGAIDSEARRRVVLERQTLAKLQHPNVVRVVEQGETDSGAYIAMEYLVGHTVRDFVNAQGALTSAAVRDIGLAVCGALAEVHDAQLIHRDVKGSNLIVLDGREPLRERIRLIDFGTVLEEDSWKRGDIAGTLPYMAPEIFSGGPPSLLTDIYSLGVTLFFAATSHLPYNGDKTQIIAAALAEDTPRASSRAPTIDPRLDEIIGTAMARSPSARYQSAREMDAALRALEDLGRADQIAAVDRSEMSTI